VAIAATTAAELLVCVRLADPAHEATRRSYVEAVLARISMELIDLDVRAPTRTCSPTRGSRDVREAPTTDHRGHGPRPGRTVVTADATGFDGCPASPHGYWRHPEQPARAACHARGMALPPGPRSPAPVQTVRWALRPVPFMEACRRRYGEVFTVRLVALGPVVFLADPAAVREVFTGDGTRFEAGEGNRILEPVVGSRSVLLLDGREHLRQRRLLLPPFHGERLRAYAGLVREAAERDLASWPLGRPFPLRERMQAITLQIIAHAVFGVEPARGAQLRAALRGMLDVTGRSAVVAMVPALQRDFGPWSPWARFRRARGAVDALVYAEIARRRAEPPGPDVLSLLLEATDEDGQKLSDEEVRDELVTLLVAGHETTATALAWAFERLLRHPAAMARLRDEVGRGEEAYLEAVVKETLRLRSVLSIVVRRLVEPTELAGHALPAGARVAPCLHLVHRSPRLHPEPTRFRPERFLDGGPEPYTWIPFGGGTRRCLGAGFALLEMREVLRAVVLQADLRPALPGSEGTRRRGVTLSPAGDALAVLEGRT
jgi:cytochrome P450